MAPVRRVGGGGDSDLVLAWKAVGDMALDNVDCIAAGYSAVHQVDKAGPIQKFVDLGAHFVRYGIQVAVVMVHEAPCLEFSYVVVLGSPEQYLEIFLRSLGMKCDLDYATRRWVAEYLVVMSALLAESENWKYILEFPLP